MARLRDIEYRLLSGVVGRLIDYYDITFFYKKYQREINDLLVESLGTGITRLSFKELFDEKWDENDPYGDCMKFAYPFIELVKNNTMDFADGISIEFKS